MSKRGKLLNVRVVTKKGPLETALARHHCDNDCRVLVAWLSEQATCSTIALACVRASLLG